jgi:hypothetical protein
MEELKAEKKLAKQAEKANTKSNGTGKVVFHQSKA